MKRKIKNTKNLITVDLGIFPKKQQEILKQIYNKQKGSFFSLEICSDDDFSKNNLKKKYREQYVVSKISYGSVRTGIKYDNMKKTIEKRLSAGYIPSNKVAHWTPIDDIIGKSKKSDTYYLLCVPNGKWHSEYWVNGQRMTSKQVKDLGILHDSYWDKEVPEFMTIKIKNIIKVY